MLASDLDFAVTLAKVFDLQNWFVAHGGRAQGGGKVNWPDFMIGFGIGGPFVLFWAIAALQTISRKIR